MSTLLQMRNRVQDASNRQIGSSDTQVTALINDAYYEVCLEGRLNLVSVTLTLINDQGDYSIFTGTTGLGLPLVQAIKYLTFSGTGGVTQYAQPVGLDEIIELRGASVQGTTPYLYALSGADLLSIYPTPTSGDVGTLYYFKRPTALVADGDEPPANILPPEFHDLIVLKALVQSVRTLHKGTNAAGQQMSLQYQGAYESRLAALRRWRNRHEGSRNQMVQIGPPRRPAYRNDVYYGGDNS